jgi:hypothetical protein
VENYFVLKKKIKSMKTSIEKLIKHSWLAFPILLAIIVWPAGGCATSTENPLTGWHFYSRTKVSRAITDDYQNYIQNLPPKQQGYIGDVSFFEDETGQHAVTIEIFEGNKNASWQHVLIYDKKNKRIKVIRYGHHEYRS